MYSEKKNQDLYWETVKWALKKNSVESKCILCIMEIIFIFNHNVSNNLLLLL